MKTIFFIGTLLIAFSTACRSESDIDKIRSVVEARIPAKWHLSWDNLSLVASASKVKLLNPISLPAHPSSEGIWDRFSWESDFHVLIRITPKVDTQDYAALLRLRSDILARRIRDLEKERGEKIDGKSRYGIEHDVNTIIALPYCHSEGHSIWISTTDDGILMTRPETARHFSESLKKALADQFTLYEKNR